ncbi:MAG TPA: ABC transporter permease [Homoserinimonas sp.]|nr:ABC transporter permease [Homoserinimonas sp.]
MNWVLENLDLIGELTVEHIRLSITPIILGLVIALPLGWLAYRFVLSKSLILTFAGLLYAIPSLALFVLLPPALGISFLSELNVTIALTLYAVAIMARSVADGLDSVEEDVKQSATAVGYSNWSRFWSVELPLAGPVIVAGLRVTAVSTVSLVTVGILIGVHSLGYLFTNGLQRRIIEEVAAGVIMTVLVALLFDLLLMSLGRLVLPWARDARMPRLEREPVGA